MYIKFNDSVEHYNGSITAFKTQNGNKGVRVIGEGIPENTSGFKVFDDEDNVIGDFSAFTHIYNENEYTETEEQKVESHSDYVQPGPSIYDSLASSINAVNQRVTEITPYTESKTAYIDDIEIEFDVVKEGSILLSATDSDGDSVEVLLKKEGNKAIGQFLKPLEKVTKVTMSIQ